MGWNSTSQIITNAPQWQQPISDELLYRGAITQEANTQKNLQDYKNIITSIQNIPALAGKDEEVLSQRMQELQQQLSQVSLSDLNNPRTTAQINSLISQYANDPDIIGIAHRGNTVQNELKRKQEFEEKGKPYVSKILRDAERYLQEGNYYRDKRFTGQGYISGNNEDIGKWAKEVPEWEDWVKNGAYDDHRKGKAYNSLFNKIYQGFTTDPNWVATHTDNFEQQIEGQDLLSYLDNPSQTIAELFPHLPDELKPQAEGLILELQAQKDNPYIESSIKTKLKELYFEDQAALAAKAHTYTNTVDHRVNEFAKSANDFNEVKQLKLYDLQLKTGLVPEKGESSSSYIKRLSEAAYNKDLEIARAKQEIKTEAAKELEGIKQENRIELVNKRGEKKTFDNKGATKINLNGEEKDKKSLMEAVEGNDVNAIKSILKGRKEVFLKDDEGQIQDNIDGGIKIDNDGNIIYQPDEWGGDVDVILPKEELLKFIADPSYSPKFGKTIVTESPNDSKEIYILNGKEYPILKSDTTAINDIIKDGGIKKK